MQEDAAAATPHRTPWHLWLVGILGLLWDSVGGLRLSHDSNPE